MWFFFHSKVKKALTVVINNFPIPTPLPLAGSQANKDHSTGNIVHSFPWKLVIVASCMFMSDYQCMLQSWASGNWRAAGFSPDPAAQLGHVCQHVSRLTIGHPGIEPRSHRRFSWPSDVESSSLWKMCFAIWFCHCYFIKKCTFLTNLNLPVRLCPSVTSRFMGQWVSPGGCGWRTPSTITSTTRNMCSCKKNRQVFFSLVVCLSCLKIVWHLGSRVPVAENKHSWNSHENAGKKSHRPPPLSDIAISRILSRHQRHKGHEHPAHHQLFQLLFPSSRCYRSIKSVIRQISPMWY